MNSLTMYTDFCRNLQAESIETKLEHIRILVKRIYAEITSEPYDAETTPLFAEIRKASLKQKAEISNVDAYIISEALLNMVNDDAQPLEALKAVKEMPTMIFKKGAKLGSVTLNRKLNEIGARLDEIAKAAADMHPDETEEEAQEISAPEQTETVPAQDPETVQSGDEFLQLAQAQIGLYNRIAACCGDGQSAVDNYTEFMNMIVSSLAAVGITEIRSEKGVPFNSEIHDAAEADGVVSDTAAVQTSVRAGFRYGDTVLQKEKVAL